MSQDYSPSLVTKNLVFCGDAAMKSAAGPATLLYDKVNDNNGTMYNGTCLDFDGTNDYVTIPHNLILDNENALTIECWINTSFDAAFPGEIGVIRKGSGSASGWTNAGWSIRLRDDIPAIAFRKKDDSGYWDLYTGDKIIDGNWHHIVGTFDTTTLRKYVDGVETQSTSTGQAYLTTTENLEIGRISAYLDGSISNVKLYNVALSAANVKELYDDSKVIIPTKNDASGGFVTQTNLKGWWPLTEGVGTIAYDGSGNGNDGTLTNMDPATDWLTGQTGCPQLVEGYNRPITFNVDASSTDYVDTGDVYAADEMTLVAWVNMSVVPSAAAGNYPMMFGKRDTDTQRSYFFAFQKGSSKLYWEIKDAAGVYYIQYSTKTSWNANQWYHVAVNYVASTGIAKMYIDGVEDAGTFSPAQPWSLDPIPDTSATCRIGGGYYWFEGIINEAAIYNKALGATDIAALAATDANGGPLPPDLMTMSYSTSSTSSSNVIGYWRNDNNVTWTDLSGNGKTGTVSGAPPSLLFKQGYNGQKNVNTGRDNQGFPLLFEDVGAIGFTSPTSPWTSSSYVDLGSDSVLDLATGTIDMWFRLANPMSGGSNSASGYLLDGGPSYFYFSSSSSKLFYFLSGGASNSLQSNSGTWDTNWHNVVVKSDGVTAYMYIDGVQQSTTADASTEDLFAFDASVKIGHSSASIVGQIAGLRLYNRALTYAEIQQNYNSFKVRFGE